MWLFVAICGYLWLFVVMWLCGYLWLFGYVAMLVGGLVGWLVGLFVVINV